MTRPADGDFWFDASPLARPRVGGLTNLMPGKESERIGAFARANGLVHDRALRGGYPNLLVSDSTVSKDVVATPGEPMVEFGNQGWKYWIGTADDVPSRMGSIGVRHGCALPEVVVPYAHVLGAKSALNVASTALRTAAFFESSENSSADAISPFHGFRQRSLVIAEKESIGVEVLAEEAHAAAARELLTAAVVPVLVDLADSFTVEIRDEWIFAYSHFGDISTDDPEVWAWAFATASRMLELGQLWRETWPLAAGKDVSSQYDPRAVPFYTARRVERPSKLDGIFSPSRFKRQ